ncbi:P-loop NTPase [Kordiimonas sp. SCSIO 12610]|uniref:nucleotide-binding protein n=1 Tax=Kordiimonas sp. SCSIO 12610 TaxID=2829597 RepID=UPI00210F0417|nr:P-loop NTPase [Kordiimonas sp. SCSIO 12610]UTW54542.1 P-loop NTPase [Kordiimonas sp. SCSIO 12610]
MTDTINNEKKLITVASGKGGVGKTWFSVTLTHALSHLNRKAVVFDGDLGLANVDIQLGQMPNKDLGDVISGSASLKSIVSRYDDKGGIGFDYVPGKSGSGALGSLSRDILRGLKADLIGLAQDYDHLLLDMAAGVDPAVTTLSNHQGKLLVVMTADPTSLTDAYAFIKITIMKNPKANISIVVNSAKTKREGERTYEAIKRACEGFLKISPPLQGIIRSDSKVVDAIRSQVPLLTRHPQSDAAADVKAIAASLV